MPGLEVMRRCRVDAKSPAARFTEVFTNRGPAALNLNAQIFLNSGNGGWQATVSDSGQLNPAVLGKQETGVVLFGPAQNGQVSVALYLAGPSGAARPAMQPMGNGRPGFSYSFTLPPQKTATIIYGAAQCRVNAQPDAKAVAALLKPFRGLVVAPRPAGAISAARSSTSAASAATYPGRKSGWANCWPCWSRTPARPISWPSAAARG